MGEAVQGTTDSSGVAGAGVAADVGGPPPTGAPVAWKTGEVIRAFYRSSDEAAGPRYVCLKEKDHGDKFPLIGVSAGWLDATVVTDFDPINVIPTDPQTQQVHLEFNGTFRDPNPSRGLAEKMERRVPHWLTMAKGDKVQLKASVFCVRWWEYLSNTDSKWSDCDVTNDKMVSDLFDGPCGLHETLKKEYEVITAWVRKSEDLTAISADHVRRMLSSQNLAAWYFLWPTRRTDADSKPGCVGESEFFGLSQRVERVGIPSGWPHISYVYRLLRGRLWAPQMCLNPVYHVPATTRVHYAEFMEMPEESAERAIECLLELRKSNGVLPAVPASKMSGVAKIGFAQQGELESIPFCGTTSLVTTLNRLYAHRESMQIVCLLQERVPDVVCELRVLVFDDAVKESFVAERIWSRHRCYEEIRRCPDLDTLDEDIVDEPLVEFFNDDAADLKSAEDKADQLVEEWLFWFMAECPEPPQAFRLDLIVSRSAAGEVKVWTQDMAECGSSLCGRDVAARSAATINGLMRNDGDEQFPSRLPPVQRR